MTHIKKEWKFKDLIMWYSNSEQVHFRNELQQADALLKQH